ncbi:MAG: tetratricopeptide repeat protein [Proteobacteria bacterium]|jgi:tetratricopeptide (TPR) repeat protein|nr:tetratricopeptide repeat protein [Pseudomonadota bacterium]
MEMRVKEFTVAYGSGDFENAEQLVVEALADRPDDACWLNRLGLLYMAQGQYSDALAAFDRAVCADPHFLEPLLNGAIVLSDLGFYDEATSRFDAARILDNSTPSQAGSMGAQGGPTPPVGQRPAQLGVAVSRTAAEKYLELSDSLLSLGLNARAQEAAEEACRYYDHARGRLQLARTFLAQQMMDKAVLEIENARRHDSRFVELHVFTALLHLVRNDRNKALDALTRAEMLADTTALGQVLRTAFAGQNSAPY